MVTIETLARMPTMATAGEMPTGAKTVVAVIGDATRIECSAARLAWPGVSGDSLVALRPRLSTGLPFSQSLGRERHAAETAMSLSIG